jgi:hypothetical protein
VEEVLDMVAVTEKTVEAVEAVELLVFSSTLSQLERIRPQLEEEDQELIIQHMEELEVIRHSPRLQAA